MIGSRPYRPCDLGAAAGAVACPACLACLAAATVLGYGLAVGASNVALQGKQQGQQLALWPTVTEKNLWGHCVCFPPFRQWQLAPVRGAALLGTNPSCTLRTVQDEPLALLVW